MALEIYLTPIGEFKTRKLIDRIGVKLANFVQGPVFWSPGSPRCSGIPQYEVIYWIKEG